MPDTPDPAADPLGALKDRPYTPDPATDPLGAIKAQPFPKLIPSDQPGVPGMAPSEFVATRLRQQRTWKAVEPELRAAGEDPEKYRQDYQLKEAKAVQATQGVGTQEAFVRNSLPFGDFLDVRGTKKYAAAVERFKAGKATGEDAGTIARYERLQELDRQQGESFGGKLVQGLASVPKIGGEAYIAGPAAQKLTGALGLAAPAAGATLAQRATAFVGERAAMTPLMPSLYAEDVRQRNVAAGRDANDVRGLPTPLAMGFVNNLVLGGLQQQVGGANLLTRSLKRGVVGAGEASAVELAGGVADTWLPEQYKTHTNYGPLGRLFTEPGSALKDFAATALTFGVFAGLHDHGPTAAGKAKADEVLGKAAAAADALHAAGATPEQANAILMREAAPVQAAIRDPKLLTKADLQRRLDAKDDGPLKDYAQAMLDALPDAHTAQAPAEAKRFQLPAGPKPTLSPAEPAPPAPPEPPIVQFRRDAAGIEAALPPVPEGHTRLWRGNRPGEEGQNPSFTNDLPGIALPFRKGYKGKLTYVDVPTADLPKYEQKSGVAPGAEFRLPGELARGAKSAEAPSPAENRQEPGTPPAEVPRGTPAPDQPLAPPAPKSPLEALSADQVKELAKSIGLSPAQLKQKATEPWVAQLVDTVLGRKPPEAPRIASEPPAPESAQPPAPAPEPAPAGPPGPPPADRLARMRLAQQGRGPIPSPEPVRIPPEARSIDQLGGEDPLEPPLSPAELRAERAAEKDYVHQAITQAMLRAEKEARGELRAPRPRIGGPEPRPEPRPDQELSDAIEQAVRAGLSERIPPAELRARIERRLHDPEEAALAAEASRKAALRRGEPAGGAAAAPAGVRAGGLVGHETRVVILGGEAIPGRYEVRELGDLVPSNTAVPPRNFLNNVKAGRYPPELQPRDYESTPGEQNKVWDGARLMESEILLSGHPTPANGTPVIAPDGVVINGNGRAMLLQAATHVGTYPKYKAALEAAAERFGIDPAKVRELKQPVLVRVVDMDPRSPEAVRFAREGNNSETQGQSPEREAASLAPLVEDRVLASLKLTGDATFSGMVSDRAAGRAFRQKLFEQLPASSRGRFFQPGADAMLTDAGKELVRNILLAKLGVPIKTVEALHRDRPRLLDAVESVAPQLLKLSREKAELDVTPALRRALDILAENPDMKSKADVFDAFDQLTFEGRQIETDPATQMMLQFAVENANSPRVFRDRLVKLANGERPGQGQLNFGGPVAGEKSPAENAAQLLGVKLRPGAKFGAEFGAEPTVGSAEAFPPPPDRNPGERGGIPGAGGPLGVGANFRGEPKEFALARAKVTPERAERGVEAVAKAARVSNPETWAVAQNTLARDPQAATRLADELLAAPRPTTAVEQALLLNRRVALANEYHRAEAEYLTAQLRSAPNEAEARARRDAVAAERDRLDRVTAAAGTQLGRALQFMRQLAKEDYSLGSMLRRAEAEKGKPLTEAEKAAVGDMHRAVAAADARVDAGTAVPAGQVGDKTDLQIAADKARTEFNIRIADMREAAKPPAQRLARRLLDVLGLARAVTTGLDLPPLFRQMVTATLGRPTTSATAFAEGLWAIRSERDFDRAQKELLNRPNAMLYDRAGLALLDTHTKLEETFMSRLMHDLPERAGAVPIVGPVLKPAAQLLKATQRGYTASLNRLRADLFDLQLPALLRHGDGVATDAQLKKLGDNINVATGYSRLPGRLEQAAAEIAQGLFAPRYLLSTLRYATLSGLRTGDAANRRIAAKEYARTLVGAGVFYALWSAWDEAKVSWDPRSSDFGKVRIGNTRLDPLRGVSQVVTFGTRTVGGETVNGEGRAFDLRASNVGLRPRLPKGSDDNGAVISRFLRTKMAPLPGAGWDWMVGHGVGGDPVTPEATAAGLGVPLSLNDVWKGLEDLGVEKGTAAGLLMLVGMGSQTYTPGKKRAAAVPLAQRLGLR